MVFNFSNFFFHHIFWYQMTKLKAKLMCGVVVHKNRPVAMCMRMCIPFLVKIVMNHKQSI